MFCHKCGAQMEEGQVFCHKCGTKVVYAQESISDEVVNAPTTDASIKNAEPEMEVETSKPEECTTVEVVSEQLECIVTESDNVETVTDNVENIPDESYDEPGNEIINSPDQAEVHLASDEDTAQLICPSCGAINSERAKFCFKCGAAIGRDQPSTKDKITEPATTLKVPSQPFYAASQSQNSRSPINQPMNSNNAPVTGAVCPYCGSKDSTVFVKNYKEVYNKNFGCGDACCGYVIFGPLGLLCGLCGRKHSEAERNETWHSCNHCGKQFRDRKEAKDKLECIALLIAIVSVVLSFILSAQLWSHSFNIVSLFLAAGLLGSWIALGVGASVFDEYPIRSLFTKKSIKTFLLISLATTLVALIFGGIIFR